MSDIARRTTVAQNYSPHSAKEAIDNPFSLIPEQYRGPAFLFWGKWSDLLKTQLSLALRMVDWIELGLTVDDFKIVARVLCEPAKQAQIRYVGELNAQLAEMVNVVLESRRTAREQEERRRQTETDKANALSAKEVVQSLSESFNPKGVS